MKKIRAIKYLMVLILFLVFINSTLYIDYNNLTKVKPIEKDNGKIKPNVDHSPIIINGNGAFNLSNGVTFGDGTYGNPFLIEDFTIDIDGPTDCIFINNTNAYFKIQNCTLKNSDIGGTTIRLNNVTNGWVFDNDISSRRIFLINSHNITISNNNIHERSSISVEFSNNNTIFNNDLIDCRVEGIHLAYSDNNKILDNYIKNSSIGIRFEKSSNNTIKANEIYDCESYAIGIGQASNNSRILENYIYNNGGYIDEEQIYIDTDCYGTIMEGNFFRYREIILPEIPWLYIILAVVLIGAGVIIGVVLYRRYRRTKEYKHPEPPEFPEPDEPPATTEQVDLPEPPELDED